ncbi:sensor histidine kinase [Streptomyces sp. NPDC101213]|uniref:sensor histidine kinase n=1 Tax=Streptomyces sp. NPDC101213 TaxID=3366130 RepID=UPI00382A7DF5
MPDRVSPTRPVTHRRARRTQPPADRYVLGQIRAAAATPATISVAALGMTFTAWQLHLAPEPALFSALGAGIALAAATGHRRAKTAATAAFSARAAWVQQVIGAVQAADKSVRWSADQLCTGGRPPLPDSYGPAEAADDAGDVDDVVKHIGDLQVQAVTSLLRVHDESESAVLLEMLLHMARREHALVHRALAALDELQELTDDPETLEKLFEIDHLVTRMRRLVESKALLGGGESLRRIRQPVSVTNVLRASVAEVVQYPRVQVTAASVGASLALPGHVGSDLTHLLAELIENACDYSDPSTKVQVRAQRVAKGLAIEVEDRAIMMAPDHRAKMNALLHDPDRIDVSALVRGGHIGLVTAAKIAKRHRIAVHLSENPTGGTTALVVVPTKELVDLPPATTGTRPQVPGPRRTPQPQPSAPAPAPQSAALPGDALPPLPQRPRGQTVIPAPAARQTAPATAPRPGMAAAFHDGQRHARTQGTPPPAHP